MKDKMTATEFKEAWKESGEKTNKKGRPILKPKDSELTNSVVMPYPHATQGNKKVRGAKKQYDSQGNKVADSKWELQCLRMLEMAGLEPEKQRAFEILPTIRDRGCKRTLGKRTWSPDFTFDDLKIVADAKGWTTEIARIKIQIFLDRYFLWSVYVLKTEKDVYELIEIIKERREK